jgi:hypothetical protein
MSDHEQRVDSLSAFGRRVYTFVQPVQNSSIADVATEMKEEHDKQDSTNVLTKSFIMLISYG